MLSAALTRWYRWLVIEEFLQNCYSNYLQAANGQSMILPVFTGVMRGLFFVKLKRKDMYKLGFHAI